MSTLPSWIADAKIGKAYSNEVKVAGELTIFLRKLGYKTEEVWTLSEQLSMKNIVMLSLLFSKSMSLILLNGLLLCMVCL